MYQDNSSISPVVGSLLLVALAVALVSVAVFTFGDVTDNQPDRFIAPVVDISSQNDMLEIRLLRKNDAERVIIDTPSTSDLSDTEITEVGRKETLHINPNDKGTIKISASNSDDKLFLRQILIDELTIGRLILVKGSGSGGDNYIRFQIENKEDGDVGFSEFIVRDVRLDDLKIDTETAPSRNAQNSDNELKVQSVDNGWCGIQKPKTLPINSYVQFSDCKAGSEPSVSQKGDTMNVTLNGVKTSANTNYIGIVDEELADIEVEFKGEGFESLVAPLIFDTYVVPNYEGNTYSNDIDRDTFSNTTPELILVREDSTLNGEIDGENINTINLKLLDDTTVEDSVEQVEEVTGRDDVTIEGSIDGEGVGGVSVSLGDNAELDDVYSPDSLTVGDNADIEEIDGSNGKIVVGDNSNIDSVEVSYGRVEIGANATVPNDIKGIDDTVEVGADSSIPSEISNVTGDVILNYGVTVSEVSNVDGEIICNGNVQIQSGSCDR